MQKQLIRLSTTKGFYHSVAINGVNQQISTWKGIFGGIPSDTRYPSLLLGSLNPSEYSDEIAGFCSKPPQSLDLANLVHINHMDMDIYTFSIKIYSMPCNMQCIYSV